MAVRDVPSILRHRDFEGLSSFSVRAIVNELKTRCPVSFNILAEMVELKVNEEKNTTSLALIYAIIMFKRCHELSLVQRVNSVLLADCGDNTEVKKNKYENIKLSSMNSTSWVIMDLSY